jgi:hypothetical protein
MAPVATSTTSAAGGKAKYSTQQIVDLESEYSACVTFVYFTVGRADHDAATTTTPSLCMCCFFRAR